MGGMKCLLLLLCAGVTVSSAVDLQKRVIHGKPCGDAERGYHVRLIGSDGTSSFLCCGSLISDSYVLTAAHCLKPEMTAFVGVHPGPPDPPQGVKIIKHELFPDNGRFHDIMLLKLETSTKITHINLPTKEECDKRHQLTVQIAGYGDKKASFLTKKKGKVIQTKLHCGEMKVDKCPDFAKCGVKTSTEPVIKSMAYAHILCGKTDEVDAANGDSGGGVVNNCRIYGVHSNSGEKACKVPAAFMDVCEYKTWIEGILKP